MIETIITICALTMVTPYYDCNSHIDIEIYNGTIPDRMNSLGMSMYGHSIFDTGGTIKLVHDYKVKTGKWDHLLKGKGVLWHEILHMKCKCDWHKRWDMIDDMKDKKDNRMHNHVMLPTIPQSIIPFLKDEYK